jgi:hypothetical protein
MNAVVPLLLVLVGLAAALAWIAIAQPGPLWRKRLALLVLVLIVPVAIVGVHELLGRPKPAALEWVRDFPGGATVIGYRLQEPEAIYLWLVFPDETEPRAYALPWNLGTAEQLQDVHRRASEQHQEMIVEQSEDADPYDEDMKLTFHLVTPRPLMEKPAPEDEDFLLYQPADD